jgi:putative nucleotidyltransferase with HDIG domain
LNKVNSILNSEKFKEYSNKNKECEKARKFCRHDLQHSIDVGRIAYIMTLENNLKIDKEIVYATALLHDIGRWMQYSKGISHEMASYELAQDILIECAFSEEEKSIILNAILNHRQKSNEKETFEHIFYLSDKLSRNCFNCKAIGECNWSEEKKNYKINY